ncbi:type I-E CRISPR-associated protein Cas7/Cse4/CasC [Peterkaempfera bronchialis]|uniref:Type I-E CRISPR-associated protein Cas7/Cse4/CasC n=1 Tax=Peterkaempfera bronchialis TaxID=2126346 RepID=A0A345T1F8_9ACTN|nr:type I-E CRISPR-associated protein Cas7/Cse4/CasC [Peterkaempfera bronchialis]AXI79813.1 type I-E CRISPR-associated protein Cas7/Cse4/CasC [Peterkaempfera bronchialis]
MTDPADRTSGKPRFLDFHITQTLPYSNVNRDDLGSPKTVTFGGTTRTRVSSQAWKRPTRLAVEEQIGEQAVRTRRLPQQVAGELVEQRGWPADLAELAGAQIIRSSESKLALEKGDRTTASLLFLPDTAAAALADIAEQHREALEKALGSKAAASKALLPKDAIHKILRSRNGSIALFGRMLAEIPGAGVDGAVQVAHAFTTHSTSVQADFFTAVDDAGEWAEDAGSAHMNTGEYSSGVFYRYATLDLRDLSENVPDRATARGLAAAFATAFISTLPSAKKTSTAPHTVPDLVHVSVRSDRPLSLAAAFEKPVQARSEGWGQQSREALSDYAARIQRLLGDSGVVHSAHASVDDKAWDGLGQQVASYPELVAGAVAAVWSAEGAGQA